MNPFNPFDSSLGEILSGVSKKLQAEARRLRYRLGSQDGETSMMLELLRPNLGSTHPRLRRWLEPAVAACAVLALAALMAVSVFSFGIFLLACALIYAILTKIFGIELGLQMPQARR